MSQEETATIRYADVVLARSAQPTRLPIGALPRDALGELTQEDLIDHARQGNPDAWEALYRRAYPSLLAYAQSRLDRGQAEDAVSETMLRAIKGIRSFHWHGVDFTGWLFGIHRHVVIDAQRRRQRALVVAASGRDGERSPSEGEAEALEALLRCDEHARVRRQFRQLGPKDQELLHLRVIAGLSVETVAAQLGKRPGTVRVAQCRALQRLRRLLEEVES